MYLVRSEVYLSAAELGQGSYELSRHIHRHDPLLEGVLADDGVANEALRHWGRPEERDSHVEAEWKLPQHPEACREDALTLERIPPE